MLMEKMKHHFLSLQGLLVKKTRQRPVYGGLQKQNVSVGVKDYWGNSRVA